MKSKIPAPPHGLYVLTQDVKNPKGNYKCKHEFWRVPVWSKGTKLIVEFFDPVMLPGAVCIRPINGYQQLLYVDAYKDMINAISPYLKKIDEDTLEDILLAGKEMWGINSTRILTYLSQHGFVSLADVKTAIAGCRNKR